MALQTAVEPARAKYMLESVATRWNERARQIVTSTDQPEIGRTAWLLANRASELLREAARVVCVADIAPEVSRSALHDAVDADNLAHNAWGTYLRHLGASSHV